MQIQLEPAQSDNLIHHLESHDGGFRITVGDGTYDESVILTPQTLDLWGVRSVSSISEKDFTAISRLNVEVVLVGTGTRLVFPTPKIYSALINQGIGVEFMDTPAACRTYNILAGDGRKVAAALILE